MPIDAGQAVTSDLGDGSIGRCPSPLLAHVSGDAAAATDDDEPPLTQGPRTYTVAIHHKPGVKRSMSAFPANWVAYVDPDRPLKMGRWACVTPKAGRPSIGLLIEHSARMISVQMPMEDNPRQCRAARVAKVERVVAVGDG
jgi:hypothetical protein